MDMPAKYCLYKTTWRRIKRWQDEEVWDKIFKASASTYKGFSNNNINNHIPKIRSLKMSSMLAFK
ncbi:MAG: hypothetical protein LZ172_03925 [Thaumarchaeota archaeon]|nr:hypothetical protein [Candidatus Geocrenenecus arthurdayi]MCL7401910.1 hypothetical protein [Candidatus Geocrenenecus arthurdayi]MCL7403479.1 hypothetical protein [Candidatus Geocrenenecus arthurdayi]